MGLTVARKLAVAGTVLVVLVVVAGLVAHGALDALADVVRISRDGALPIPYAAAVARTREQGRALLLLGGLVLVVFVPWAAATLQRELGRRRDAEAALADSEARFRAAVEGSRDAFYVLRAVRDQAGVVLDFEFIELNREAERLLGVARHAVIGQRLCELVPANRANGFLARYVRVMESGMAEEGEHELAADSRAAWVHDQVVPLVDGVAITSRDVSERRQREEALRALSLMDELTGLYNRRGFLTLAEQQLKVARRGHREVVLLFVDMDDFKEINDRFGHQEGDQALQRTAAILRQTFRDSDIVARMGGDEFVVLASDIAHGTGPLIVERLRHELAARNERDGFPYRLSFSVGVATFDPERPPELEDLLATADAMLYEQKRARHEETAVAP